MLLCWNQYRFVRGDYAAPDFDIFHPHDCKYVQQIEKDENCHMVDNRHYRNLVYDFDVPGTLMLHADAVIMERLFECQGRGTPRWR